MTADKIQRINALAAKAKASGLTPEEKEEQAALRREYINEFRQSLISQLDNTYVVDNEGHKTKLERKIH